MKIEEGKSNDFGNNKTKSDGGENDIRSRLRKNPNKTKFLYTDDFNDQKSKKKNEGSSLPNIKDICRSILEIVKKDDKSFLFRQPAIKSFIDSKDKEYYKKQIKEPRDLGTIAKKLKLNDYSAKNFYDDMELCWSNAMSFNDNNTEAYQNAVYLKDLSNKLYKENGLLDYINKDEDNDKDIEKDINSNNHGSSNNNTNDSNNTPNKTPSKINKKDKTKKDNDKSIKTESISSNSYDSDNNSIKNDNTDSSYSSEIKNNKLVGRKRKRQKNKDNKNEQNEEKDEENKKYEEKEKTQKKRGRKKKIKNEENNLDLNQSNNNNKLSLEDIKKKYPIKHQILSNPDEIDKILKKRSKIKYNDKLNDNNSHSNHHNSECHISRKNTNSNNNNNMNNSFMTKEESRKIFYEYMWEFFNGKPFFPNYFESPGQVNPYFKKFGNDYFNYSPMRYKTESKEMLKYDTNCNTENVYKMSINQKRKQSQSTINSKSSKKDNTQKYKNDEVKNTNSINNSNNGNIVKINDKKNEKNMQLRIEIAKYFDNLSDNNMIDVLVYIENIRPQSLRVLQNDTIYIDMEAFNEDIFNKVYEFVKKYF